MDEMVIDGSGEQRRGLGICWIVYGLLRIVGAVWMIGFSGTATVMFGALLTRVPNAEVMMADFHVIYTCIVVLGFVCGVVGVLAGIALLSGLGAARLLGIVAGVLAVSEIPLGLTLGVWTLVVLLPRRGRAVS
jgi:hypothetical protein